MHDDFTYGFADLRCYGASRHLSGTCTYPMQECPPYFATIVEDFLRDAAA
ncbi:hypothetical protein [Burkholderia sp. Bp8998]|nr:hypothetical protein [Burkholderia sp. Bp8998]